MSHTKKALVLRNDWVKFLKIFYFTLVIILTILWYIYIYEEYLDNIEDPIYFGYQGILNSFRFQGQYIMPSDNLWIALAVPDTFLDTFLQLFGANSTDIYIIKHIYRTLMIFIPLFFILNYLHSNLFINFNILVILFSTQIFHKNHWDTGSHYSLFFFLLTIIIILKLHGRLYFLFIAFVFLNVFTLSSFTNPPARLTTFFAIPIAVTLLYLEQINQKQLRKVILISSAQFFIFSYLFYLVFYSETTLGSNLAQLKSVTFESGTLNLLSITGFGLWWGMGQHSNGLAYWPAYAELNGLGLTLLRTLIIVFIGSLYFSVRKSLTQVEKNTIQTLLLLYTLLIFLTMNLFNIWNSIYAFSEYATIFREYERKFGYVMVFIGIILILLIFKNQNLKRIYYNALSFLVTILAFLSIFTISDPKFVEINNFYPNLERNLVQSINKDIDDLYSKHLRYKDSICLYSTGEINYDRLVVRNFMTKSYLGTLSTTIPILNRNCEAQLENALIKIVLIDPEKKVQIRFNDGSQKKCVLKWYNSFVLLRSECGFEVVRTENMPIFEKRFQGPGGSINPREIPFYYYEVKSNLV